MERYVVPRNTGSFAFELGKKVLASLMRTGDKLDKAPRVTRPVKITNLMLMTELLLDNEKLRGRPGDVHFYSDPTTQTESMMFLTPDYDVELIRVGGAEGNINIRKTSNLNFTGRAKFVSRGIYSVSIEDFALDEKGDLRLSKTINRIKAKGNENPPIDESIRLRLTAPNISDPEIGDPDVESQALCTNMKITMFELDALNHTIRGVAPDL